MLLVLVIFWVSFSGFALKTVGFSLLLSFAVSHFLASGFSVLWQK